MLLLRNPLAPPTGLSREAVSGPLRIGITGGIGSGKSLVARFFEVLGIPLYQADARAKDLMCSSEPLRAGIVDLLGAESYFQDGTLNRGYIAGRVYADKALSQSLNALVHPAVEADYETWASDSHTGALYTLKEAALLFEANTYRRVHYVLHISAPEAIRIERTLARDPQRTRAQVEAILALQLPEAERETRSHFILHNSGKESIIEQALALHEVWKEM